MIKINFLAPMSLLSEGRTLVWPLNVYHIVGGLINVLCKNNFVQSCF